MIRMTASCAVHRGYRMGWNEEDMAVLVDDNDGVIWMVDDVGFEG